MDELPLLGDSVVDDGAAMAAALALGRTVRRQTSPNPWVGSIVLANGRVVGMGATDPPGGAHAERLAIDEAATAVAGSTLFTTLEPCDHEGRTGPCTEAIVAAGVKRVVVGVEDPDPKVAGRGVASLRAAGLEVEVGVLRDKVVEDLASYLHHRATGRPYVVLKMASTLDGRTAAPDGTSRWITGSEARADVHELRADSDAVCVGAGTVRADNPRLDIRDIPTGLTSARGARSAREPRRIVLGSIPEGARVLPAEEHHGELGDLLDELGAEGVLQLLVEGGADVAGRFHRAGLVDRYVIYVAPALLGGEDGRAVMAGCGVPTMNDVWRGTVVHLERLGGDIRIDVTPSRETE